MMIFVGTNVWHIALAQDDERDADILARWIRMGAAICDFHREKVTLEEDRKSVV